MVLEKSTIRVAVLEGTFACLSELGIPLPACIQMQSMGLKLGEATWTARSTNAGFSVSFFWPTGWKPTTRRVRKRKKRKAKHTSPDHVVEPKRGHTTPLKPHLNKWEL